MTNVTKLSAQRLILVGSNASRSVVTSGRALHDSFSTATHGSGAGARTVQCCQGGGLGRATVAHCAAQRMLNVTPNLYSARTRIRWCNTRALRSVQLLRAIASALDPPTHTMLIGRSSGWYRCSPGVQQFHIMARLLARLIRGWLDVASRRTRFAPAPTGAWCNTGMSVVTRICNTGFVARSHRVHCEGDRILLGAIQGLN